MINYTRGLFFFPFFLRFFLEIWLGTSTPIEFQSFPSSLHSILFLPILWVNWYHNSDRFESIIWFDDQLHSCLFFFPFFLRFFLEIWLGNLTGCFEIHCHSKFDYCSSLYHPSLIIIIQFRYNFVAACIYLILLILFRKNFEKKKIVPLVLVSPTFVGHLFPLFLSQQTSLRKKKKWVSNSQSRRKQ